MKSFDKQNLATIRNDLNEALAEVAKKHGIVLNVGNISFRDESFSAKLTALIPDSESESGAARGQEVKWAVAFKKSAFLVGLKATDLGRKVNYHGEQYTIAGMRTRAKLPIVLKRANGSFAAFGANDVVKNMV